MEDYYTEKCSKCNANVKPVIKKIGGCMKLKYTCKCCGHTWSIDKWVNE